MTITTFWSRDKLNRKEDGQLLTILFLFLYIYTILRQKTEYLYILFYLLLLNLK